MSCCTYVHKEIVSKHVKLSCAVPGLLALRSRAAGCLPAWVIEPLSESELDTGLRVCCGTVLFPRVLFWMCLDVPFATLVLFSSSLHVLP